MMFFMFLSWVLVICILVTLLPLIFAALRCLIPFALAVVVLVVFVKMLLFFV